MKLFLALHDSFQTPIQAIAHISYLLLVVSMMMRNMTRLRILAIVSGLVEITYRVNFLYDPVSIFWKSLFILVNLVQLAIIWSEKLRSRLTDDEEHFIATVIPDVHRSNARRLVKCGDWLHADEGAALTSDGVVVPTLIFISSGHVTIQKDGVIIATCGRGDFLGEISFVTGEPATADAIATTPVRYLGFEREALRKLLDDDAVLRHALESSFNRNLIDKLVKSNEDRVAGVRAATA
ncbi:MAG TPA: cyclic nucleotide-binding domain-containing protein [Devosiaceae bacterium]